MIIDQILAFFSDTKGTLWLCLGLFSLIVIGLCFSDTVNPTTRTKILTIRARFFGTVAFAHFALGLTLHVATEFLPVSEKQTDNMEFTGIVAFVMGLLYLVGWMENVGKRKEILSAR